MTFPLLILIVEVSVVITSSQNVYVIPAYGYMANLGDIYNETSETVSNQSVFKSKPSFNITDFRPKFSTYFKNGIINSLQDKVKLLNVDATFVSRVKTNFIVPNKTRALPLALEYLNHEKKYSFEVEGAVYQKIRTGDLILRLQEDLRKYLKENKSNPEWNPLVIVKILYGSNLVVQVLDEKRDNETKKRQNNLKEALNRTAALQNLSKTMEDLKFTVFSDTVITQNISDWNQVIEHFQQHSLLLKKYIGVPVEFIMIRLNDLKNISSLNFGGLKYPYDFQTVTYLGKQGIFRHLSDLITANQIINDFDADISHHGKCIPHTEKLAFKSFTSKFNKQSRDFKNLAKNYNGQDMSRFLAELNFFLEDVSSLKVQGKLEKEFSDTRKRVSNCRQFAETGVEYLGEQDFWDDFQADFWEQHDLLFIMYYSLQLQQANPAKFNKNLNCFSALNDYSISKDEMLIVDCEFHPNNCLRMNSNSTVIKLLENGQFRSEDVALNIVDVLLYIRKHKGTTEFVVESTMEVTENSGRNETSFNDEEESTTGMAIVGAVVAILGIILGALVFVVWTARKKIKVLKKVIRRLSEVEVQQFFDGDPNFDESIPNAPIEAMPFDKKYEIAEDDLIIYNGKVIGSGHFGIVMRGSLRDDVGGTLEVAVKTSKASSDVMYFKSLLGELKILAYLGPHDNVASLIGAVTTNIQSQQVLIATEWCQNGDLHRFLVKNRKAFTPKFRPQNNLLRNPIPVSSTESSKNFSTLDLLKWSIQVAKGMRFLEDKKVIHGDLATRNVLLSDNNDAKISDFGLSRQLIKYSQYKKKSMDPLPWRWMAIEALRDLSFSLESDVWSYGVTVWEIFSLGEIPFPGQTWDSSFLSKLISGDRLNRPQFANAHVYNIMLDCWLQEPSERPSFGTVINQLQELLLDMGSPGTSQ